MIHLRMILLLAALLPGFTTLAETSAREDRDYDAALKLFQDEFWGRAEQEWRDFTIKFPQSTRLPEAVLFQARSAVEQGDYSGAVQLLQENQAQAGDLEAEYLYWIGEAQFRAGDYASAAETFERVSNEFPGSSRALEAVLGQGAACGRQKQWNQVITILQKPDGTFLSTPQNESNHELMARCQLLLAEAFLAEQNYPEAKAALTNSRLDNLNPSLEWQKEFLQARTLLASEQLPDALAASSNLVSLAGSNGHANLMAEAVLFQGRVLERMNQIDQSLAVYRQNLSTNVPPSAQRQTLLRVSDLLIARNRLAEARQVIEQFIAINPDQAAKNLARVTIAELDLREQLQNSQTGANSTGPGDTSNLVSQAITDLNSVIQSSTNAALRGKAFLNLGWAEWIRKNYSESGEAFKQAALLLPPSESQATARFKWADSLFLLGDLNGARTNYEYVADSAAQIGGTASDLVEPALYQTLRAGLAMDRPDLTTNVLDHLLDSYPDGFLASAAVLLTGQEFNEAGNPGAARQLFEQFLALSPDSELAPEIHMAIARTYEAEGDWERAIESYDAVPAKTNAPEIQTRAGYYRALDTALSGNETNALALFDKFITAHPSDELAPRAQWWVADYYWRHEDFAKAELNYQLVFKNWPASDLAYQARMMAGRTAMARARPEDAIPYFTNLTSDLNCPPGLKPKAMLAYGDALLRMKSTDTNDAYANIVEAIRVYSGIERSYPTNILAARAQGMIGQCYLQFALQDAKQYNNASNSFQQVIRSPVADFALRSEAEVGLATVLEKLALNQTGEARTNLLQQALDHYLNVFYYEKILREGEKPDQFWVRKAGLEAGRLAESLQAWPQALKLYQRLQAMIPSLKPLLENKILRAREQAARART